MSTTVTTPSILDQLAFLDALVRQIGPGRVRNVSTIGGLGIHPVDAEDGHVIAAELGLTEATDYYPVTHREGIQHRGFTSYRGDIEGHDVGVHASLRHVVVDSDTGETLTPPLPHADATALVAATTGRNVRVQAVTR